ncbi:hypothetical protein ABPG74_004660 [Tetrahymena malaccensis]
MKQRIALIFGLCFLLVVNADDDCIFTIDQLNNQTLKLGSYCQGCFTSDVIMTIQSNQQQITSITLTAKDTSSNPSKVKLIPSSKSLTIDSNFLISYQTSFSFSEYNFMSQCQTKKVNGKLTYNIVFNARVESKYQFFVLNNGFSNGMHLTLSYLILCLCYILLFV